MMYSTEMIPMDYYIAEHTVGEQTHITVYEKSGFRNFRLLHNLN